MYKQLPSYDVLMNMLRQTISAAWHLNSIHKRGIEKWLDNFSGEALVNDVENVETAKELEHRLALFLLCNFVYYNEDEIKHLMKVMLEKYIHYYLTKSRVGVCDEAGIENILTKSKFSKLGNESESSAYMLYLFRQINELSKKDFEDRPDVENIVFVDDFSITGSQAETYIKKYLKENPKCVDKNIYVLLMVSTKDAIERIKGIHQVVDVLACIVMDDTSKAFSSSSIVFKGYSPELKEQAKRLCEYYGERIKPEEEGSTALGFGGGGYLLGAYYNTPNNSLPIFWSEMNNWKPFFKRYNKKYAAKNQIRIGGLYV